MSFKQNILIGSSRFSPLTGCFARILLLSQISDNTRVKRSTFLLALCDNIQNGLYISPKQLTNWLFTLFIKSHTCDKLFNSMTPNKSKSKQLANTVWGLFVTIYRCSQAVTALQSTIGGNLLMSHLRWQVLHSTHGRDAFGSLFSYTTFPPLQQLFTCLQHKLLVMMNDEA